MMAELLTDAASPVLVIYSVGERVSIVRGPLRGLTGSIAEICGSEVLVDLRDAVNGLLVRCPAKQLTAVEA